MMFFTNDEPLSIDWYLHASSNIGMTLSIHLGLYYSYKILVWIAHACLRCHDRSYSFEIKSELTFEDDYLANSR
jgi:hypothetical protein